MARRGGRSGGLGRGRGGRLLRRVLWSALIVVAIAYAIEGGEFGTLDLLKQRRHRERLLRSVDSVARVVDSLRRYRDRLLRDPKLQERIAREEFGMVRGEKELLYRFGTRGADSAAAGAPPSPSARAGRGGPP